MVATIDLAFLAVFLVAFLFVSGLFHPGFWFLCSFVSFYSMYVFTDLYPDTLWAFVFLAYGIMLIPVTIDRIVSEKPVWRL